MNSQNHSELFQSLTTEGLEKLRTLKSLDPQKVWTSSLDLLTQANPEDLVETRFRIDQLPALLIPNGKENFDKENAKRLFSSLAFLTPVEAADERIWVSMALGKYRDYLSARWPKSARVEFEAHLDNHVFATTSRNRFRDQAIARLWWIARFIERNFFNDTSKAYSVFFDLDADVLNSYLGRPNLVAVQTVAKSVVEIAYEAFIPSSNSIRYDRQKFRDFLKDLDLENGRQLVSHKTAKLIDSQVESTFRRHFPDFPSS